MLLAFLPCCASSVVHVCVLAPGRLMIVVAQSSAQPASAFASGASTAGSKSGISTMPTAIEPAASIEVFLCGFFAAVLFSVSSDSRMGAPGSPNSTFYNSWAPPRGAPLKYMANRYAKTFSAAKRYVLQELGALGPPNVTFSNSWAPPLGAPLKYMANRYAKTVSATKRLSLIHI